MRIMRNQSSATKNTFNHHEILKEAPGIVDYVMDMPEGFMKNHDQHFNQEGWYSIEMLVCLLGQAKMHVELSSPPIGQKIDILLYPEVIGILVKHAHPSHYTSIAQIGHFALYNYSVLARLCIFYEYHNDFVVQEDDDFWHSG